MTSAEKVRAFAQELIDTKRGKKWRPFISREDVRVELFARGYELIEDGADWNPLLLRFYAIDHAAARQQNAFDLTCGGCGGPLRLSIEEYICDNSSCDRKRHSAVIP